VDRAARLQHAHQSRLAHAAVAQQDQHALARITAEARQRKPQRSVAEHTEHALLGRRRHLLLLLLLLLPLLLGSLSLFGKLLLRLKQLHLLVGQGLRLWLGRCLRRRRRLGRHRRRLRLVLGEARR